MSCSGPVANQEPFRSFFEGVNRAQAATLAARNPTPPSFVPRCWNEIRPGRYPGPTSRPEPLRDTPENTRPKPALPGWELVTKQYPSRPVRELERGVGVGPRTARPPSWESLKASADPNDIGSSSGRAAALQNEGLTNEAARDLYFDLFRSTPIGCGTLREPPEPSCPSCTHRFAGSRGECPPPCLNVQSGSDFNSLDVNEAARHVVIHGATSAEEKLLLTAWAVLLENQDLLEWVLCWMYGRGGGDCYINRLNRTSGRVEIKVTASKACRGKFNGGADLTGGRIHVCARTQTWKNYTAAFASRQTVNRMCSAIDLAATLFHELTHLCWRSPDDTSCSCEYSYMVENLLRWCIMQRYPDAATSACCDYATPDRIDLQWGSSCSAFPKGGCR